MNYVATYKRQFCYFTWVRQTKFHVMQRKINASFYVRLKDDIQYRLFNNLNLLKVSICHNINSSAWLLLFTGERKFATQALKAVSKPVVRYPSSFESFVKSSDGFCTRIFRSLQKATNEIHNRLLKWQKNLELSRPRILNLT